MGSIRGVPRGSYKIVQRNPVERFHCWKCKKSYKRKVILAHHIKSKHLNYHVICPICSRRYTSVSTCHRHLKKSHCIQNYSQFKLQLQNECVSTSTLSEKLSFESNKSFPCMANNILVKENGTFGKHLVAAGDIDIGQVVMAATSFASIDYLSSTNSRCFHCGKKEANEIKCPHCIDLFFCSKKCSLSEVHRSRCNSKYSHNDSEVVRLVVEIISVAFRAMTNVEVFVEFCSGILFFDKKPKNLQPPYSIYAEMLLLKGRVHDEHFFIAQRIVRRIKTLPLFESFKTQHLQRFLFNLAYRHTTTIEINMFSEVSKVTSGGVSTRFYIYDILSRYNHSCVPNIRHIIDDDETTYCVAVRPIKKGEQLFINYVIDMPFENDQKRKDYIMELWGFKCYCEKCITK